MRRKLYKNTNLMMVGFINMLSQFICVLLVVFRRFGFKLTSKRLLVIQERTASAELFQSIFSAMLSLCCHCVYNEILLLCLWNVVKALF